MLLSFYISFHSIGINGSLSECLFFLCVCVFYFVVTTEKFTFFVYCTYFTDYKECVSHDSRPIILLSIHIWIYCANQISILVAWYCFPKRKLGLIFILHIFNKQYFRIYLFFSLVFGVLISPKGFNTLSAEYKL